MAEIKDIKARMILDSRGIPTVEADIILSNGITGRASVPSGASTGSREAIELRDGGKLFSGKGVETAIRNIQTEIKSALVDHDVRHQTGIDEILINLDATENKSKLGANAILAVSMAAARAAAKSMRLPLYQHLRSIFAMSSNNANQDYILPMPLINIINGGAHANNSLDVQEFMIIPVGAHSFKEAIVYGMEVFQALKGLLKKQGLPTSVGDEGGFAPDLANHEAAIELILLAITAAGFKAGSDIALGLDLASSEFYHDQHYQFTAEKKSFDSEQFADLLKAWVNAYPIISIEDGMAEADWAGWKLLTEKIGNTCQLVGDDLFVTNTKILNKGITENIANAILIKPNQIGTLTETFSAMHLAKAHNYNTIISHRSGETEDSFIADLAVATNAGQIKTGSMSRGERTVKYNQLLRIEEALGKNAKLFSYHQENESTAAEKD